MSHTIANSLWYRVWVPNAALHLPQGAVWRHVCPTPTGLPGVRCKRWLNEALRAASTTTTSVVEALIALGGLGVRGHECRVPRTLDRPRSACYPNVRGGTTWGNNARKTFQHNDFRIIKRQREHEHVPHWDGKPTRRQAQTGPAWLSDPCLLSPFSFPSSGIEIP